MAIAHSHGDRSFSLGSVKNAVAERGCATFHLAEGQGDLEWPLARPGGCCRLNIRRNDSGTAADIHSGRIGGVDRRWRTGFGARAQAFPTKPIRFIVPFAAGGNADVTARLAGEGMSRKLGQPVIVDNRPGAGGVVGQEMVLQAPPDGYTMVIAAFGTLYVSPLMAGKPSMVPSFAPVSMLSTVPMIVVVPASSPFKDWQSLMARPRPSPARSASVMPATARRTTPTSCASRRTKR